MKIIGVTKIYSHFSLCKPTKQTIINYKQPSAAKNATFHHKNRRQEQKKRASDKLPNAHFIIFSFAITRADAQGATNRVQP